jgi:thiol-disulfide isomerase/thioredoxin
LNLECTAAPLEKTMHPDACGAAAAGVCAQEQGDFWMMHDRLFEKQSELKRRTYLNIAEELGLDKAKFEACLENPATLAKVKTQTEIGAKNNVTGTPVFFINGRQMSGAQPIEVLRAVVEAELAGNKGLLDLSVQVGAESIGTVEGQGSVTVAGVKIDAFEAAIEEGKAVSRAGSEPTRGVSWFQAKAACEAAGKRLCTEKEWLSACTGQTPKDEDGNGIYSDDTILGRRYGYGDYRRSGACADSRNPEAPGDLRTGIHPQCGTPEGVYDMTGGVKEWVGLTPGTAALKGGSFSSGDSARCGYFRDDYAPMAEDPSNGFRCCEGPAELPPVRAGREAGEKLSDFTVPLLDGGSFKLADIKGKPAVLTFWASWCGPCKKELPILSALYQKYKAQGLMVAGISVDSDEGAIRRYLTASPLPFLIAWDKDSALMGQFTSRGVPTSIWVDKTGLIRLRTTGVPPSGEKRLEELVAELLGTQAL